MRIVVSRRAKKDLVSITSHIAMDNISAARDLKEHILHDITLLSENPKLGRPGRVSGTRELLVHRSYIAAYQIKEDEITVLTIRHAARLWPESFD